jgi:pimeloyl-ACP methyl ester carboxylesterase
MRSVGLTVLLALAGCHEPSPAASRPSPAATPTPPPSRALPDDGMVDVGGGTSLHVHCVGDGSPLVVLDECSGCDTGSWQAIQPSIGRFTRACAYDRAGVMYSSPPPSRPHLDRQLVGELRRLLGDRDDRGPVVLVGQGTGGLIDQIYARDFPRSVVGMVLVDPATKDYDSRYYAQFPPEAIAKLKEGMTAPPEYLDFDDQVHAMQDLRSAPLSLGDRPLVVVNHGKPWADPLYGIAADSWAKLETVWMAMEADVASLSTNSLHVAATEAEWVPDEAPDRVVTAVWDVVSSARTGVPLSRLATAAPPLTSAAPTAPAPTRPQAVPIDDGLVDIGGGASLHIHCVGSGTPIVVMEAGLGDYGRVWSKVQGEIGRVTRACVYDRMGLGFSSGPAPRPHPIRQMATELHTLLDRAGAIGPYVLVGHSMGGVSVRLFAAAYPDATAGMILVDSSCEDQPARFWALIPPADDARFRAALAKGPDGLDIDTFAAGLADLRTARSIGDRPLVILTSGRENVPPSVDAQQAAKIRQSWMDLQGDLLHLSTNATQIVAEQSGHYIELDAPKLVIASVFQVVQAVRTHGRVNGNALLPLAREASSPTGG